ncbi:(Fe-S)-binding protein, partial [Burkholderia sp. SIMBA_013]
MGVGRCRSDAGGVMCPSYRATGDEKDSTRGRSRALQDMVRGAKSIDEGWKSKDVRETLDLCLACKACSNDC